MIRQVLSIFNFKRIGRIGAGLLSFVVIFAILAGTLNYFYADYDLWSRIVWHGFYQQEKIDRLALGSSHVYCDLNPYFMDEKTGQSHFNLCTSGQRVQESYYNLLEADRHYDIKKAYVELYYLLSTGVEGDYSDNTTYSTSWRNTDYMSPFSPVRYQAIGQMNDSKHLLDALFPFVRFRKYTFDKTFIQQNLEKKHSEHYRTYTYHEDFVDGNGSVDYLEKGYMPSDRRLVQEDIFEARRISEEMTLSEDAQTYLLKILAYCQKNDIELTLFVAPMWETELLATENYDAYSTSIKKWAKTHQVPFYDFNLCKEEYLPLNSADYFYDVGHLNKKGSQLFSQVFYEVVNGSDQDTNQRFYQTYAEKLAAEPPQIYGAYTRSSLKDETARKILEEKAKTYSWKARVKQGFIEAPADTSQQEPKEDTKTFCIASNREKEIAYRIFYTKLENKEDTPSVPGKLLQDFSTDNKVTIPNDTHGALTVVWRLQAQPDSHGTMVFKF